ncbi:MAG: hypothetical protein DSZ23_05005 [Thermodesulfatator sp.]|nr:MAG: hypothetical protein DSZ23_05005 [Thermodesulfatator sp.]
MKLVRFERPGTSQAVYGKLDGDAVSVIVGSPYEGLVVASSEQYPLEKVKLLSPCEPTKIVAVGLNYLDHARELGMNLPEEPLIFLKPPSAVIGHKEFIVLPEMSSHVEYEAELGVVIGKRAHLVEEADAYDYILGFTCVNDVTARDLQKRDVQFTRSKSFDTFCPLGPFIETELDPSSVRICSYLNGQRRQDSNTQNLIHKVPELVSFISHVMTLEPGDVIATGTPFGVGRIVPGDEIAVEIQGLGTLVNPVK